MIVHAIMIVVNQLPIEKDSRRISMDERKVEIHNQGLSNERYDDKKTFEYLYLIDH